MQGNPNDEKPHGDPAVPNYKYRLSLLQKQPVKVFCRIRPPSPNEQISKIDIDKNEATISIYDGVRSNEKLFSFHRIYDQMESQALFVKDVCNPAISKVQEQGRGSLIFSYGVTNSGKTHTILGTMEHPGILPYLIKNLEGPVLITAFEIYNDQFYSLGSRQRIYPKDHGGYFDFGDYQPDLVNEQNMDATLKKYMENRATSETRANPKSSRSHAIFKIESNQTFIGVVDLAGSQRTNKALGNAEQTSIINKSLLSLGKCIQALKERSNNPNFVIPYRESKLTKVLMDFFAPEFYDVVVIANLNTAESVYHESIKVLQYAATAKDIKRNHTKSPLSHIVKKSQQSQRKDVQVAALIKNVKKKLDTYQKQRTKKSLVEVPKKTKSVIMTELKSERKPIHEGSEEEDQFDKDYYEAKIRLLSQELMKMEKRQNRIKLLATLEASQKMFDFNFELQYKREQEETARALEALRSQIYTSPVAERRGPYIKLQAVQGEGHHQTQNNNGSHVEKQERLYKSTAMVEKGVKLETIQPHRSFPSDLRLEPEIAALLQDAKISPEFINPHSEAVFRLRSSQKKIKEIIEQMNFMEALKNETEQLGIPTEEDTRPTKQEKVKLEHIFGEEDGAKKTPQLKQSPCREAKNTSNRFYQFMYAPINSARKAITQSATSLIELVSRSKKKENASFKKRQRNLSIQIFQFFHEEIKVQRVPHLYEQLGIQAIPKAQLTISEQLELKIDEKRQYDVKGVQVQIPEITHQIHLSELHQASTGEEEGGEDEQPQTSSVNKNERINRAKMIQIKGKKKQLIHGRVNGKSKPKKKEESKGQRQSTRVLEAKITPIKNRLRSRK